MPGSGQPRPKEASAAGSPPPEAAGLFYVLHGGDELGTSEELAKLKKRLGADSAMADLNTNVLAGAQLTMGELRHACDTIPFLSERRLVIVRGLLARLAPARRSRDQEPAAQEDPAWKRAFVTELLAYLPQLPPTTRLVFVESELLEPAHRVLRFALERGRAHGASVVVRELPKSDELPGTIQKRVRDRQGTISSEAVRLLADLIGPDLRLLDLEIEKLLAYADGKQVTAQDVELLVSQAREVVVFELTDCMSRHETAKALQLLHRLIEEQEEPLYLLSMLSRQIRILMQVGQLRTEGLTREEITRRLGLHPYVVDKALAQASGFSMSQLEAAHSRLVETDWAIKTGEIEPPLALDLLVIALSR